MRDLILVGAITDAHGLKGEVRLVSFMNDPHEIAKIGPLYTKDGRQLEITSFRPLSKGGAAFIKGITNRTEAEALIKVALHVPRDALPPAGEEEFYVADLIGLTAMLKTGETLGTVIASRNFGAGDLLDVQLASENRSVYVPFTMECVPVVDLKARQLVIDPPPGLLDDPSKTKQDEQAP